MVELVDTKDLKSFSSNRECRFDSGLRQFPLFVCFVFSCDLLFIERVIWIVMREWSHSSKKNFMRRIFSIKRKRENHTAPNTTNIWWSVSFLEQEDIWDWEHWSLTHTRRRRKNTIHFHNSENSSNYIVCSPDRISIRQLYLLLFFPWWVCTQ